MLSNVIFLISNVAVVLAVGRGSSDVVALSFRLKINKH